MEQTVSALRSGDLDRLARQLARVDALIAEHLGRGLVDDDSDLDAIQGLLDGGQVVTVADLQSLGLVVGQRLVAAIAGLGWVIVEDDAGRDPALRLGATSLLVYPLTMIYQRVERGDRVTVRDLFEELRRQIDEIAAELA
jgi:hypothetical protein